jgi:hypothetical protein
MLFTAAYTIIIWCKFAVIDLTMININSHPIAGMVSPNDLDGLSNCLAVNTYLYFKVQPCESLFQSNVL